MMMLFFKLSVFWFMHAAIGLFILFFYSWMITNFIFHVIPELSKEEGQNDGEV